MCILFLHTQKTGYCAEVCRYKETLRFSKKKKKTFDMSSFVTYVSLVSFRSSVQYLLRFLRNLFFYFRISEQRWCQKAWSNNYAVHIELTCHYDKMMRSHRYNFIFIFQLLWISTVTVIMWTYQCQMKI